MKRTLSDRLQEFKKKKEKSGWVIPKVVAVAYGSFHYKVSVAVQMEFCKGGRN